MNPKKEIKLAHKLVTLNWLLLEVLDELNPSTKEILEYKENLIRIGEALNDEIADTQAMKSTNYFSNLSKKVDTVIRVNLDINM